MITALLLGDTTVTWIRCTDAGDCEYVEHPIPVTKIEANEQLQSINWLNSKKKRVHLLLNTQNEQIENINLNLQGGWLHQRLEYYSIKKALVKKNPDAFIQSAVQIQQENSSEPGSNDGLFITRTPIHALASSWLDILQEEGVVFVSVRPLSQLMALACSINIVPADFPLLAVMHSSGCYRHVLVDQNKACFTRHVSAGENAQLIMPIQQSLTHVVAYGFVKAPCPICIIGKGTASAMEQSGVMQRLPPIEIEQLMRCLKKRAIAGQTHTFMHNQNSRNAIRRWVLAAVFMMLLGLVNGVFFYRSYAENAIKERQLRRTQTQLNEAITQLRADAAGLSENAISASKAFMAADKLKLVTAEKPSRMLRILADNLTKHQTIHLKTVDWWDASDANNTDDPGFGQLLPNETMQEHPRRLQVKLEGRVDSNRALRDQQSDLLAFRESLDQHPQIENSELVHSPLSNASSGVFGTEYTLSFQVIKSGFYER